MDRLRLSSLTNKPFPFSIFFSILPFLFNFLLFSSLLFSSSFVFASVSNSKALSTQEQCIEDHFSALLYLKQGFNFSARYSKTRLPSWNPDNRDCCSWEGITCHGATGHVTSLDLSELDISGRIDFVSLFRLQSLQKLNLASNEFDGSPIPSGFEHLTSLTHLNLSWLHFYGQIPLEISHLTTLVSLDLSFNRCHNGSYYEYLKLENLSIGAFVQNLSSLRELHLDWVDILAQSREWGLSLSSALPLLHKLSLRYCGLSGPIHSSLSNLHFLSELHLAGNNLSSVVPNFIGNFSSLTSLRLRNCSLHGKFPESIFRLPNLQTLDVGYNPLLTGEIPPNNTLQELSLSDTGFCSNLRDSFSNSKVLKKIQLRHCNLTGQFPSWLVKLDQLMSLDLSYNGFSGPIPMSIFKLTKLQYLSLSSNNFSGDVDLGLFQNLKNLLGLDLSDNNFSVHDSSRSNSTSMSFPQIKFLSLRSCNITKFPDILRNQDRIHTLHLSNNRINGEIPNWIWNVGNGSLYYLNLSHNALEGLELPFPRLSLSSLEYLDLSFNKLEGSIPIPPPFTIIYSLTSNHFSGEVPSHICNCTSLQFLDLSNNRFNGSIPLCLGEISDALTVLNLGGNAFHGTLIQTFKEGCNLKTLDLNGNQLEGQVPKSLVKCKMLELLNLGNNQIHDTFPFWLKNLSQLRVLILRSNKFHGSVGHPLTNLTFPMLQIFDLSFNSFTGSLPSNMFRNWKVMKEDKSQLMVLGKRLSSGMYYQDRVIVVWKGLQIEVVKILIAFTSIDLSNNEFHGGIPESIGDLKSLLGLNMSHNHFTGRIPISFGNIKALESLDMSQNNLSSEIPLQLNRLTFLAVLNLSHNLLVGSIPQGQQFNTFTSESFLGNLELCGPPLSNKCKDIEALLPQASLPLAQSESKYDWKLMAIGFGVGYGAGMSVLFWTLTLWTKGQRENLLIRCFCRFYLLLAFDVTRGAQDFVSRRGWLKLFRVW